MTGAKKMDKATANRLRALALTRTLSCEREQLEQIEAGYAAESAWRRDQAHANVYARDATKKEITR
jgi:hypothetical protein